MSHMTYMKYTIKATTCLKTTYKIFVSYAINFQNLSSAVPLPPSAHFPSGDIMMTVAGGEGFTT